LTAPEIFKQINEIMPFGKLASGFIITYLFIPIISFPERLIIGAVFAIPFLAINYFAINHLILKVLSDKVKTDKDICTCYNLLGLGEGFSIIAIIYLCGGTIW